MSKSRTELIRYIREARRNANADIYVKGLSKMKKKQLQDIAESLNNINENTEGPQIEQKQENNTSLREREREELTELEIETETEEDIESEPEPEKEPEPEEESESGYNEYLDDLSQPIPELDDESNAELSPIDELVDMKQIILSCEEKPKEKEVKNKVKKRKGEDQYVDTIKKGRSTIKEEIKNIIEQFRDSVTQFIKPYQRKYRNRQLSNEDVDDIIDTFNYTRGYSKDRIEVLLEELEDIGEGDLPERFYRFINDCFDRQSQRVERIIR
jgi:uncharacterized phage infection (PIP) family protein YhgE